MLPPHAAAKPAAWCSCWSPLPLGGQLGSQGMIARRQLLNLGSHCLIARLHLLHTLLHCLIFLGHSLEQCNQSLHRRGGEPLTSQRPHHWLLPWLPTSRWPRPMGRDHQWPGHRCRCPCWAVRLWGLLHSSWSDPATITQTKPRGAPPLRQPKASSVQVAHCLAKLQKLHSTIITHLLCFAATLAA